MTPTIAKLWASGYEVFDEIRRETGTSAAWLEPWFAHFAPGGRAPRAGEVWSSPEMASSLEQIADSWAREYYQGSLAEKMDDFSRATGGYLGKEDLADYWCEWVKPVSYTHLDVYKRQVQTLVY